MAAQNHQSRAGTPVSGRLTLPPMSAGIATPMLSYGDVCAGQPAWWRLVAWRVPLRFLVGTQNQV